MTEQFANLANTTLTAPISASQKTITVSNASTFPLQPQFRIVVQSFDSTTGLPVSGAEIMLVTGVAGNTFTVQRAAESATNYPAIAFAAGAKVVHILTAAVMQALQSGSGVASLNGLTGIVALSAGTNVTLTPSGNTITIAASGGGGAGTVSSVAMTGDGTIFSSTVSGSPITSAGTLAPALLTQSANFMLAGPVSGTALAPTFRAIVSADVPTLNQNTTGQAATVSSISANIIASSNISISGLGTITSPFSIAATGITSGTVTSVALSGDGVVFTSAVTGSPVTSAGTLAPSLIAHSAATFLSGPVSGVAAAPTFRIIASSDVPTLNQNTTGQAGTVSSISANIVASSNISISGLGTVSSPFTIAATAGGSGTVSSVAFSGDGTIFSATVSGSPITSAGTLAPALLAQSANKFLTGPVSGAAAVPTFRAISALDLPNPGSATLGGIQSFAAVSSQWINSISTAGVVSATQPAFSNLTGSATLTQGGLGQSVSGSTGFVTISAGSSTVSAITFGYNFNQAVSANGTIILSPYVPFSCTITEVYQIQTNSAGTCTATFQIGSASITGLSALSAVSAAANAAATSANVVSAGSVLNLVISAASSLTQVIFTMAATRIS